MEINHNISFLYFLLKHKRKEGNKTIKLSSLTGMLYCTLETDDWVWIPGGNHPTRNCLDAAHICYFRIPIIIPQIVTVMYQISLPTMIELTCIQQRWEKIKLPLHRIYLRCASQGPMF